ncbi:hypothetical protein F511_00618 [Dorcoceras hygrometricum]|nr:hypothetical protein F511_00618 [Dorcoceras hygrometricum]
MLIFAALFCLRLFKSVNQTCKAYLRTFLCRLWHQILRHIRRSNFHLLHQLLDQSEHRMLFEIEVILGKNLESLEFTVGKLDVLVHSTAPRESRIELLNMVGCEHDQSLPCTG